MIGAVRRPYPRSWLRVRDCPCSRAPGGRDGPPGAPVKLATEEMGVDVERPWHDPHQRDPPEFRKTRSCVASSRTWAMSLLLTGRSCEGSTVATATVSPGCHVRHDIHSRRWRAGEAARVACRKQQDPVVLPDGELMNEAKTEKLETAGWNLGTTKEFLGLTDEEAALIEIKLLGATTRKEDASSQRVQRFRRRRYSLDEDE